jgi:16S rRNA (cytidine1402-2'-O)-methyltransferase
LTKREHKNLKAGLYLVATPIGNLRDISLRALEVLEFADVILCEDTRVSGKLLSAHDIRGKKLIPYNDHSNEGQRDKIIRMLEDGQVVALISDAGMPLISDPGYKLVQSCAEKNIYISSIPGANAPLMALQLSGLPSDKFSFIGFLPHKTAARQKLLQDWVGVPGTLIAFESASRLQSALVDIGAVMGVREVAVARELTKLYEEVRRGSANELVAYYKEHGPPKGEIVLIIAPPAAKEWTEVEIQGLLKDALKTMKTKDAAKAVADQTGGQPKKLYDLALTLTKV